MTFSLTIGSVLVFELAVDRDGVELTLLEPVERPEAINIITADNGETFVTDPGDPEDVA